MKNKRGGNNTQSYKVYKYDLDGNFLREFDSLRDAMFVDDLHKPHLIHHIQGKAEHYKKNIYSKNYYIKYPKELLPKVKKVYQYDLNGNFVREFENAHIITELYNLNNLYDHLKGKSKKCGKFIYSYEKKDTISKWVKTNNGPTKKIVQYDLKGKFIKIFNSIIESSRELNINDSIINGICIRRKGYYQSNGFIFRYYEGHKKNLPKSDIILKSSKKPVIQYNLKGKKIKEFESVASAMRETGITTIPDILNGTQLQSKGFIFKYKN
jgi:hypothetical protein